MPENNFYPYSAALVLCATHDEDEATLAEKENVNGLLAVVGFLMSRMREKGCLEERKYPTAGPEGWVPLGYVPNPSCAEPYRRVMMAIAADLEQIGEGFAADLKIVKELGAMEECLSRHVADLDNALRASFRFDESAMEFGVRAILQRFRPSLSMTPSRIVLAT